MEDPSMQGSVPPNNAFSEAPPPPYSPVGNYSPPPNGYTQMPHTPPPVALTDSGLSDTAAGALAYITIIPAIIFLILAPYNTRPFVKFHAVQCLGLAVASVCLSVIGVIPILGWLVVLFGSVVVLVLWILCIVKASQGGFQKLPVISEFAAKQSGYTPGLR